MWIKGDNNDDEEKKKNFDNRTINNTLIKKKFEDVPMHFYHPLLNFTMNFYHLIDKHFRCCVSEYNVNSITIPHGITERSHKKKTVGFKMEGHLRVEKAIKTMNVSGLLRHSILLQLNSIFMNSD